MSGNQIFILLLIVVIGGLLFLAAALRKGRPASVEVGAAGVNFAFRVGDEAKEKAAEATREAARQRGESGDAAAEQVMRRVAPLVQVPLRRALWVDDQPDNNLYENLALNHLGIFATSATSNAAAREYIKGATFDLVITDLGRSGDPDDGRVLLKEFHLSDPSLPIVVYTIRAAEQRDELLRMGAAAVEDEPAALIDAVLGARALATGSGEFTTEV